MTKSLCARVDAIDGLVGRQCPWAAGYFVTGTGTFSGLTAKSAASISTAAFLAAAASGNRTSIINTVFTSCSGRCELEGSTLVLFAISNRPETIPYLARTGATTAWPVIEMFAATSDGVMSGAKMVCSTKVGSMLIGSATAS